jgi:hypothetical protein
LSGIISGDDHPRRQRNRTGFLCHRCWHSGLKTTRPFFADKSKNQPPPTSPILKFKNGGGKPKAISTAFYKNLTKVVNKGTLLRRFAIRTKGFAMSNRVAIFYE